MTPPAARLCRYGCKSHQPSWTLQTFTSSLALPALPASQVLGLLPARRTGVRGAVRRIRGLVHVVRVWQGVDPTPQVGWQEATNNRK